MGLRIERWTRLAYRLGVAIALTAALWLLGVVPAQLAAGPPQDGDAPGKGKADPVKKDTPPAKPAAPKLGLSINDPKAFQGYTVFSPLNSTKTFLLDMQGKVVRTWESDCSPALTGFLLENGHMLRPGSIGADAQAFGGGPGIGGRVQEFTWEGELVWDFKFFNSKQLPHHDMTRLPNGNIMLIVWDRKTAKEAIAAGRRPEMTGESHLLPDSLIEIKPTGKTTGEIVWEWHLWDHLVQDFDKTKANYGNVAEHAELVNINYGEDALAPIAKTKDGADKLKTIGYVGANAAAGRPARGNPDWTHFNGVAYNPDLDQLAVSVHSFSEFWIIDHSTTTAEAAGHSGGKSGKGGDLLYRYGNPRAYRAGTKADQKLFAQHNAHWIAKGLPGEGHLLVFNNGGGRSDGSYSSVDELVLPVDEKGHYTRPTGAAYGPDKPIWSYSAPKKNDFYSFFISGSQRLVNGNTLICSGANGTFFEVTPEKEIVWKYVNPVKGGMVGPGGFGAPPPAGQIVSPNVREILGFSSEQRTQLDELQKETDAKLAKLLSADQQKQMVERPKGGGFSATPQIGQIMTGTEQSRLKLTDEQKKELTGFQKEIDAGFDKILTAEQKKQIKDSRGGFGGGGPPPGNPPPMVAGGPPQPGQIVPTFLQDTLKLTEEQKKQLVEFQKDVNSTLEKILTDDQKKQFKEPQGGGPGGPPQAGQIMPPTVQARLKLNADQKKQVQELQKETDGKLDKLLADEQKKQFKEMRQGFGRGSGGPPGGGAGGPPGGGPPGGGGPPNMGPAGGSAVFRAYRFAPTHPGLVGKDLTPGLTIEELQAKESEKKK